MNSFLLEQAYFTIENKTMAQGSVMDLYDRTGEIKEGDLKVTPEAASIYAY